MSDRQPPPIFIICLRAQPRVEPIRALRAALKALKRRHGLQCVSVRKRARVRHDKPCSPPPYRYAGWTRCAIMSAFGGKADMRFCSAHVRL